MRFRIDVCMHFALFMISLSELILIPYFYSFTVYQREFEWKRGQSAYTYSSHLVDTSILYSYIREFHKGSL